MSVTDLGFELLLPPPPPSREAIAVITGAGLRDVIAERIEQIDGHGFDRAHDLGHHPGELALAAASYLNTAIDQLHGIARAPTESPDTWAVGARSLAAWRRARQPREGVRDRMGRHRPDRDRRRRAAPARPRPATLGRAPSVIRRSAAAQRCLDVFGLCAFAALITGVAGFHRLSVTLSLIGIAALLTSVTINARSYRL